PHPPLHSFPTRRSSDLSRERAHDVRPDRGGEKRLVDRETEGDVDSGSLAGEDLAGSEAVGCEGDLDDHVLVPRCDPAALDDHVRSEEHTSELQSLAYLV